MRPVPLLRAASMNGFLATERPATGWLLLLLGVMVLLLLLAAALLLLL